MSVSSVVELLCYFESFRNVDLFEQGFYCVRSKIYTEKNNNIVAAPLTHYNTSSPVRKIDNPRHKLFPPQICTKSNTYSTKTFWVQFTEEVIDINESVHFRIEIPDLESQVLILELELLLSPEEGTNDPELLKTVSQQKFRMKSLHKGMNQFYPIIFDEWHFAVVRFALHASLLDFTYKAGFKSFFRFPSFASPTPSTENDQDRTDISLFGIPCRKHMQNSYAKLSNHFQKLCMRVTAKQRTAFGTDYFATPPLSLSPADSPKSAADQVSSPTKPRSISNSPANSPHTTPPPIKARANTISSINTSPSVAPKNASNFSPNSNTATPNTTTPNTTSNTIITHANTATDNITIVNTTKNTTQSENVANTDSRKGLKVTIPESSQDITSDNTKNNINTLHSSNDSNSSNDAGTDYHSDNDNNDEYENFIDTIDELDDDIADTDMIQRTLDSSNNTNNAPKVYPEKVLNNKLLNILNNVRDHSGVGSPRFPPSICIPPPIGTPPPFTTDLKSANSIIAGHPITPRSGASTPRAGSNTPRTISSSSLFGSSPGTPRLNSNQPNIRERPGSIGSLNALLAGRPANRPSSAGSERPSTPRSATIKLPHASTNSLTNLTVDETNTNTINTNTNANAEALTAITIPDTHLHVNIPRPTSAGAEYKRGGLDIYFTPPPPGLHPLKSVNSLPSVSHLFTSPSADAGGGDGGGRDWKQAHRKSARQSGILLTCTTRPAPGPVPQDARTKEIMDQIHFLGEQIFDLWIRFTKIFYMVGKENTFRMAQKYEQKYLKLFKESVFREVAHVSSVSQMLDLQTNPMRHREMVNSVRNSDYYKKLKTSRFELVIPRIELTGQPIILEQVIEVSRYSTPEDIIRLTDDSDQPTTTTATSTSPTTTLTSASGSPPNPSKDRTYVNNPPKGFSGSHLYIMVHGLAGNPWDMRLFRNQIALNFPESEFLICSCVEQNTLGDIEEMGNNVAKEIVEYLESSTLNIGKISFVGHSLGGVIIRAALCDPLLAPYLHKLFTFVSLSVPHIGTLYPYSALIPGAMWVWQKWSNSSCLLQLRLIDDPDPTKTYLYKLSQQKGLEYFQNILLVSSEQDLYVPFHSARIEVCREALVDSFRNSPPPSRAGAGGGGGVGKGAEKAMAKGPPTTLVSMVNNLWESVMEGWRERGRYGEIVRYDVVFESHRGMDGIIGRSAHIRLLDSPKVMQMLITTNANFF